MTAPIRPPRVRYRIPKLGHAFAFSRDPVGFLRDCQRRHGNVFTLQLPTGAQTFLVNPHDYPAYFKDKRLDFRALGTEMGVRMFGYDPHRARVDIEAMTRTTGRMLGGSDLTPLTLALQRELNERLDAPVGSDSGSLLLEWLSDVLFAAGVDALFGTGFASPRILRDYMVLDRSIVAVSSGIPKWFIPGYRGALERLARSFARKCPHRSNVISNRAEQYDAAGTPDEERQHMEVAWLWASQVNTIVTAFWTLLHVLREPEARSVLEREAAEVMHGRDLAREPLDKAELKRLARLESAIWEVLRLTSSSIIIRRAVETIDFETEDGTTYRIEKGELFNLFSGVTHFDPEIFEEPDRFRHDRFHSPGAPATFSRGGRPLQFPLLPFGSGASMCPGRFLAMNELKIVVAHLLSRYELEITDERIPTGDTSRLGLGIPPPTHDVKFRARRRAGGPEVIGRAST